MFIKNKFDHPLFHIKNGGDEYCATLRVSNVGYDGIDEDPDYDTDSDHTYNLYKKFCELEGKIMSKTHNSGWTIEGAICLFCDSFSGMPDKIYVSDFKAHHEIYGNVYGNFNEIWARIRDKCAYIYSNTEEGYNHFIEHHPPEIWRYC